MLPIHAIILMFFFQVVLYWIIDNYFKRKGKILVLFTIIALCIFILPSFFLPDFSKERPRCGMPVLAINFAFWFIGGGGAIVIHFVYKLFQYTNKN